MEYKMQKNRDLTSGSITGGLWAFAVPLMLGNVLQQFYNLADTWVVGKYIGDNALAAVGSSYTLMTFLTSVIIGLSLGTGSFISMAFGRKEQDSIRNGIFMSAGIIGILTLLITAAFYMLTDPIISLLNVPEELTGDMHIRQSSARHSPPCPTRAVQNQGFAADVPQRLPLLAQFHVSLFLCKAFSCPP